MFHVRPGANSRFWSKSVVSVGQEGVQRQKRLLTLNTVTGMSIKVRESDHGVVSRAVENQAASMFPSMASSSSAELGSRSRMSASRSGSSNQMSSAESDGSVKSWAMSDADSGNACDKQLMERSPSGISLVTCDAVPKEEEEGGEALKEGCCTLELEEKEETEDENICTEPEASEDDHSGTRGPTILKKPQSAATTWTDDKHSSYLNSIEATFVNSLYEQQYCATDAGGKLGPNDESEQDCADSQPIGIYACCTSNPSELFELLQGGCYQQRAYYRPQTLELSLPSGPAVFASPWIQHFNPKVTNATNTGCLTSSTLTQNVLGNPKELSTSMTLMEGASESDDDLKEQTQEKETDQGKFQRVDEESSDNEELEEKGPSRGIENPEMESGRWVWQNRLQSRGKSSASVSRKDTTTTVPLDFELANPDLFLSKRNKSTQQELAWKDLEMLNQYVAGQQGQAEVVQAISSQQSAQIRRCETLQPSRGKAVLQPFGEASAVNGWPPVTFIEAVKPIQVTDRRRFGETGCLDQVVPLLRKAEIQDVKGCLVVPAMSKILHLTESTVSSCTTSQTPVQSRKLASESSTVEVLGLDLASISAPAAKEFVMEGKASSTQAPEAMSHFDNKHEIVQDAADGCGGYVMALEYGSVLGKHRRIFEGEEGSKTSQPQLNHGVGVGDVHADDREPRPPQFPSSKAKTWTWGLRGLRRRLHEPPKPSRPRLNVKLSNEGSNSWKQFCKR